MNIQIFYTEQGVRCVDTVCIPEDVKHRPEIGNVLAKFHGKKQIQKRYSNEIENGQRVRRYWYERGLLPEDYHVYKAVMHGSRDPITGTEGKFTYEFTENQKTPNMWRENTEESVEQMEMI
jgi:hypothetical protein